MPCTSSMSRTAFSKFFLKTGFVGKLPRPIRLAAVVNDKT